MIRVINKCSTDLELETIWSTTDAGLAMPGARHWKSLLTILPAVFRPRPRPPFFGFLVLVELAVVFGVLAVRVRDASVSRTAVAVFNAAVLETTGTVAATDVAGTEETTAAGGSDGTTELDEKETVGDTTELGGTVEIEVIAESV